MEMKRSVAISGGRTMDGAYSFSLSIGIGLILFIGGLVVAIVFGDDNSVGLLFGIPMIVAGVILPLFLMRDHFISRDVVVLHSDNSALRPCRPRSAERRIPITSTSAPWTAIGARFVPAKRKMTARASAPSQSPIYG